MAGLLKSSKQQTEESQMSEAVIDTSEPGRCVADLKAHLDGRRQLSDSTMSQVTKAPLWQPIEIEVEDRWHALALSELLIPFHSFLVQHRHDRWVVHARAPGWHGESLLDAVPLIDDWRAERRLQAACRVGGRPHQPEEREDA
jgi:hypothetical protein